MMQENVRYLKYTTVFADEDKPDEVLYFEILVSKMISQQIPTDPNRYSLGLALNLLHHMGDLPSDIVPALEITHRLDDQSDDSSQE